MWDFLLIIKTCKEKKLHYYFYVEKWICHICNNVDQRLLKPLCKNQLSWFHNLIKNSLHDSSKIHPSFWRDNCRYLVKKLLSLRFSCGRSSDIRSNYVTCNGVLHLQYRRCSMFANLHHNSFVNQFRWLYHEANS